MKLTAVTALAAMALVGPIAHAQATYKKSVPDSLAKLAKITEQAAAATAQSRVPKGIIQSVELEREKAALIYSYDIKTAGKSGIDEVNVDALSGKIVAFEHESPAAEKKETGERARKSAKVKKP